MASIFDKWNKAIDGKALAKDVEEAAKNQGNFEDVPKGTYEVRVSKMELKECGSEKHKGEPMFTASFEIIRGDYKKRLIFMNQLISEGFQIHIVNEFLKSMDTDVEVAFNGDYGDYNDMILDVLEECAKLEFVLEYGENKKGFNTYKIVEVFEV